MISPTLPKKASLTRRCQQCNQKTANIFCYCAQALCFTFVILVLNSAGVAAQPPAPDQLFSATGIKSDDIPRLKNGEILSFQVTEPIRKTLGGGLLAFVKTSPEQFAQRVQAGVLFAGDTALLAYGDLSTHAKPNAFDKFSFPAKYQDDAIDLLESEPGQEFNLSQQELATLAALADNPQLTSTKAKVNAVTQQYRTILFGRFQDYLKRGMSGITPYARQKGLVTDAGVDLKLFTLQNEILKLFDPKLQQALLRFPKPLPPSSNSHFFWINRIVQGEPTAIIYHRVIRTVGGATVIVQNAFYAERTFNVSQLIMGAIPYEEGALIVSVLRSSTDQLAGFGQDLKRLIGRQALHQEAFKQFQRLLSVLR